MQHSMIARTFGLLSPLALLVAYQWFLIVFLQAHVRGRTHTQIHVHILGGLLLVGRLAQTRQSRACAASN